MKLELVKLSQIKKNPANPRQMKDDRFVRLVNSVLVLPKMLELRPIVTDDALVALGGNMRYLALSFIAKLPIAELKNRLAGLRDFDKKPAAEQAALVEYWKRWHDAPTAPIIKASELTDDERREFIIKDNVGFGEWDYDMLANDWDAKDLDDWGVDVWQDELNPDELGTDFSLNDGDKSQFERMAFTLHSTQAEAVKRALKAVDTTGMETENGNKNGNALYKIIIEWDAQRKS